MTAPVRRMAGAVKDFGDQAATAGARSERWFRKLTPGLSDATKQMLAFASTTAIVTGAIATAGWSVKKIMDYESELQNLKALTGLSGAAFDVFKGKIQEVAAETKKGNVETAQLFTALANNQPELLKDADGLAAVAKSTVMLAQAAKMELAPAGEAITQILNQYGQSAKDAAKLVDILAAGSVAGSSEINDTAAAIQQFGTNAAAMGVKIDESVALIELASKFKKGADAGVGLRNILVEIAKGTAQDPKALKDWKKFGVNIKVLTDTTLPLATRLKEISKIAGSTTALFHTFGKENMALAQGVLGNVDALTGMVAAVNTQGAAAKMAADNNDSLRVVLQQLRDKWERMVTGTDEASKALQNIKKALRFVIDHMDTIITVIGYVVAAFAAWWAITKVIMAVSFAIKAVSTAIEILTALQWLWNFAVAMNPIVLIVAAIIAALVATIILVRQVIKHWDEWGAAVTLFLGPLGMIISLVQSIRNNWHLVTKAFREDGILGAIKAIGKVLLDVILAPLQQILEIAAHLPGKMGDWAASGAASIAKFRESMGIEALPEYQLTDEQRATRYENNDTPYPQRTYKKVNYNAEANDAVLMQLKDMGLLQTKDKQQLEIKLTSDPGTKAEVTKSSGNIMPVLTPSIGTR